MILTVIGLLCVGSILLGKYFCFNYGDMRSTSFNGTVAKLKWSDIKNFYRINPLRWHYTEIVKNGYKSITTCYKALLYKTSNYSYVRIRLNFIDYIKLLYAAIFSGTTSGTQDVLETVQSDIDQLKAKAQAQITKSNDQMKELENKLKRQISLETN